MKREQWMAYFDASPGIVQDYLMSRVSSDRESDAQEKLAYENDAWDRVMDVMWDLIFLKSSYPEFIAQLKPLVGDRKVEDVERVLLQQVVLPMADLVLWDVDSRLQELGVPFSEIEATPRLSLRPVSYGAAVRRIAVQAKFSLLGEEMVRRLRDALVSYLKGVRTIEQFKEILLRNQSDGGLGMSADQVKAYVEAMEAFLQTTQVLSEQEYADWLNKMQREAEQNRISQSREQETKKAALSEEQEIAEHAAETPPKGDLSSIEQGISEVLFQTNVSLEEYLKKRLWNVISTRLRDVRSEIQTKSILGREIKVGGMGFPSEEVERISALIEQAYQKHRDAIAREERQKIEQMMTAQQQKIEERRKQESEEHAKWYEQKVKQFKPEELLRQALSGQMTEGQSPAVSSANQRGVVAQVATVAPTMTSTKPAMDAVQPAVKLIGLAEELAGMTMAEFRRLSKNPDQAAGKIKQKFDTLKADGFDRWTEGVEAWRRSPLQQAYLKLVTESFASGVPVAQLAEERRANDPNLPTGEELGTIIKLNSEIQF